MDGNEEIAAFGGLRPGMQAADPAVEIDLPDTEFPLPQGRRQQAGEIAIERELRAPPGADRAAVRHTVADVDGHQRRRRRSLKKSQDYERQDGFHARIIAAN